MMKSCVSLTSINSRYLILIVQQAFIGGKLTNHLITLRGKNEALLEESLFNFHQNCIFKIIKMIRRKGLSITPDSNRTQGSVIGVNFQI